MIEFNLNNKLKANKKEIAEKRPYLFCAFNSCGDTRITCIYIFIEINQSSKSQERLL